MIMDYETIKHKYNGETAVRYNVVPKIMPLLNSGYILRKDGKLAPAIETKIVDAPWIYVRHNEKLTCKFCTDVLFKAFGIFPRSCLNCWKVVVRPRTVKELIMLLELETNHDKPCKCGIEKRDYVPALYGGYFYTNSKEEGLERLYEVRKLVATEISSEIKVTLKRYCTEFELKFGPSDQIEDTLIRGYFSHPDRGKVPVMKIGEMQVWEAVAREIIDLKTDFSYQAPFVRQNVIVGWYEWAWAHGDMTVKDFFNGQDLYTPSVTYES